MTTTTRLWALISVATAFRLLWATSLGAGNDEAYHYLFTVHPDWSYFDHPPMTAIIESAGLTLAGGKPSVLALRVGFVGLFAASTALMFRLAARFYGPRVGLLAAFLLNVTGYYGVAAGTFALPDGPLAFFWLLTLDRLAAAFDAPDRLGPWITAGLAWGGAMLSKYHGVFLPAGVVLYLAMAPAARGCLRRPGPYLALGLGLLLFAPVLLWNARHDWASFAFQGGRAVGSLRLRPESVGAAIAGQALYLFPWIWLPLLAVLVRRGRQALGGAAGADAFLLSQAVLPLVAFTAVACVRPILPHWPLVGFLAVIPMLGQHWDRLSGADPRRFRRRLALLGALPVALATLAGAHAHSGMAQTEGDFMSQLRLIPVAKDPTLEVHGWDQVADELERRGLLGHPGTFLFTGQWYHSGQLALATQGSDPVLCYNPRRAQGFAYWSRPEDWVGQDGILVAVNGEGIDRAYADWFERIEPLGSFDVRRGGAPVRRITLFRCINQVRPFPFANRKRPTRADRNPRPHPPGDG